MKEFVWSFVIGFTIVIALGLTGVLLFLRDGEPSAQHVEWILP
jgi:hypothetical protein